MDWNGGKVSDRDVLIPRSMLMPKPRMCDRPAMVVGGKTVWEDIFPSEFVALCDGWKRAVEMISGDKHELRQVKALLT